MNYDVAIGDVEVECSLDYDDKRVQRIGELRAQLNALLAY